MFGGRASTIAQPMKVSFCFLTAALGLAFVATAGCASDEARRDAERAERERLWAERHPQHIRAASDQEDDGSPEMAVSGDEGTLQAADVENAIAQHKRELLDCYGLDRRGRRAPSGRALLRFFVDGKGEVVDVAILESDIGNRRVERCLADIAVGVTLHPPSGRKPTTFDYPIEFRLSARR
jgi:hypothetical protein